MKHDYTEKNKYFEGVFHQYYEGVYLTYPNNVSVLYRKHQKRLKNFNQFLFIWKYYYFFGTYLIENSFKVGIWTRHVWIVWHFFSVLFWRTINKSFVHILTLCYSKCKWNFSVMQAFKVLRTVPNTLVLHDFNQCLCNK
jgi:hypothetical protein